MKTYVIVFLTSITLAMLACVKKKDETKPLPGVDFSFTGGGCAAPCQVVFTNNSQNATSYNWDFGEGTNSTATNPTKTYNVGGAYTVTLTATGPGGSASTSKLVTIGDPKVIADFSFTGGGCTAPCQVMITNKSQNATSYSWDFGDGTKSTQTNPAKTYTVGGTFTITLTASGTGGTAATSNQVTIIPQPIVAISPASGVQILFLMQPKGPFFPQFLYPPSCSQFFTISNVGPAGSKLDYSIVPSQTPFVTFSNGSGSLQAGQTVTITVDLDKSSPFYTSGYNGGNMFLNILTPGASNFTKLSEEFWFENITKYMLGTWSGTWSGKSYGRHNASQPDSTNSSPVNGTWILNLQSVNFDNNTASGTLTWKGLDKYWVYTFDGGGNIASATPKPFIPDRTIQLTNLNTTLVHDPGICNRFSLKVNGAYGAPNPSDAFYGPRLDVYFDIGLNSGALNSTGVGFSNSPYNPANGDTGLSTGFVTGSKQ